MIVSNMQALAFFQGIFYKNNLFLELLRPVNHIVTPERL